LNISKTCQSGLDIYKHKINEKMEPDDEDFSMNKDNIEENCEIMNSKIGKIFSFLINKVFSSQHHFSKWKRF